VVGGGAAAAAVGHVDGVLHRAEALVGQPGGAQAVGGGEGEAAGEQAQRVGDLTRIVGQAGGGGMDLHGKPGEQRQAQAEVGQRLQGHLQAEGVGGVAVEGGRELAGEGHARLQAVVARAHQLLVGLFTGTAAGVRLGLDRPLGAGHAPHQGHRGELGAVDRFDHLHREAALGELVGGGEAGDAATEDGDGADGGVVLGAAAQAGQGNRLFAGTGGMAGKLVDASIDGPHPRRGKLDPLAPGVQAGHQVGHDQGPVLGRQGAEGVELLPQAGAEVSAGEGAPGLLGAGSQPTLEAVCHRVVQLDGVIDPRLRAVLHGQEDG
jgi:hypothetical protein